MQKVIFKKKTYGYSSFRIPCLSVTNKGTLLAFTEARRTSSDYAVIDILLKRREKGGKFSKPILITEKENKSVTYNNPCVYNIGNEVHLIYCKNYLEIFHVVSLDDGKTWSNPENITYAVENLKPFSAVATGPDGAIVTSSGTIVIPSWVALGNEQTDSKHDKSSFFVLYSTDKGKTFKSTNKIIPLSFNSSETVVCELSNGELLFSVRTENEIHRRMFIKSDKNFNFDSFYFDNALNEQVCMAGFTKCNYNGNNVYFFTNPDYRKDYTLGINRKTLTLKYSTTECKSWNTATVIKKGVAGYSSVKVYDNTVYVLYESYLQGTWDMDLVLYEEELKNLI